MTTLYFCFYFSCEKTQYDCAVQCKCPILLPGNLHLEKIEKYNNRLSITLARWSGLTRVVIIIILYVVINEEFHSEFKISKIQIWFKILPYIKYEILPCIFLHILNVSRTRKCIQFFFHWILKEKLWLGILH